MYIIIKIIFFCSFIDFKILCIILPFFPLFCKQLVWRRRVSKRCATARSWRRRCWRRSRSTRSSRAFKSSKFLRPSSWCRKFGRPTSVWSRPRSNWSGKTFKIATRIWLTGCTHRRRTVEPIQQSRLHSTWARVFHLLFRNDLGELVSYILYRSCLEVFFRVRTCVRACVFACLHDFVTITNTIINNGKFVALIGPLGNANFIVFFDFPFKIVLVKPITFTKFTTLSVSLSLPVFSQFQCFVRLMIETWRNTCVSIDVDSVGCLAVLAMFWSIKGSFQNLWCQIHLFQRVYMSNYFLNLTIFLTWLVFVSLRANSKTLVKCSRFGRSQARVLLCSCWSFSPSFSFRFIKTLMSFCCPREREASCKRWEVARLSAVSNAK